MCGEIGDFEQKYKFRKTNEFVFILKQKNSSWFLKTGISNKAGTGLTKIPEHKC